MWDKHPTVALEMGFIKCVQKRFFACNLLLIALIKIARNAADDGIFYMSWEDFLKHYDGVDVCVLSNDMDDIELDLLEDFGVFGPCLGCVIGLKRNSDKAILSNLTFAFAGCLKYWLCCCGLYKLWCPRKSVVAPSS